jgi:holo-[acyl-carrier protein] synthase
VIFGIGADVVEVARVARLLERYGERFARRVLAPSEFEGFRVSPNQQVFLASRFAAKEAFAKALGTGLRAPVLLTSICVTHDAWGRPLLRLAPDLQTLSDNRGVSGHHITLSHERSIACAVVVLEAGQR